MSALKDDCKPLADAVEKLIADGATPEAAKELLSHIGDYLPTDPAAAAVLAEDTARHFATVFEAQKKSHAEAAAAKTVVAAAAKDGECRAADPAHCPTHGTPREPRDKGFQDRYGNGNPETLAANPEMNIERGKAVFTHLLAKKEGEVAHAMYRRDVGWIDADYGTPGNEANDWKGGHGVSHIVAKHKGAIDGVVDILQNGTAYKHDKAQRKVYIIKDHNAIVLSKKRDGRLLITDYENISEGQLERYTSRGKYHVKGENE